jgi:cytochrome c oxidase cbb3-type subunit III
MKKIALTATVLTLLCGCKREQRTLRDEPAQQAVFVTARQGSLVPGGATPEIGVKSPAEGNAYSINEGQRLFSWYNCAGCHGPNGGGAIGPPLTSKKLTYGSEPENIYDTISRGRPKGMPSWGSRVPQGEIWELVAYIRSLSGSEPKNASPARTDNMEAKTKAQLK